MDAFRYVELPDPYIYVIDPVTGATKAVVDKFFSFLWVEKRTEAGELEITAPEDVYWGQVIQEGDYVQFRASSVSKHFRDARRPSNVGRYTMVVETKYTEFDADNGYTTYVKGHSLDILLQRRINLGITGQYLDDVAKDGYLQGGFIGGYSTPTADTVIRGEEDRGENYRAFGFLDGSNGKIVMRYDKNVPFIIENLASESNFAQYKCWTVTGSDLIYELIDCNCGNKCLNPKRKFPNFEVYRNPDIHTGEFEEAVDSKFENVYDIVTDLLPKISHARVGEDNVDEKSTLGMRLVGWTEGVTSDPYTTVFKMGFELYYGEDWTINGPHKSDKAIIYSRDMDNLISMNYLNGEANYKNVIYYDTGYDYTPDDLWAKQKEKEAKEKEKDLLSSDNDAKQKQLELEIDTLEKEIENLEKKYDDLGLRMPYMSVIDRNQMKKYDNGTADPTIYPEGLDRREMYVDEELPFIAASNGHEFGKLGETFNDDEEAEWQGRAFAGYRYTYREDPEGENQKPKFHDRWIAVEWPSSSYEAITRIARKTFIDPDNSKENDVEAELNYNAVYQPKRNYDIGDIVTVMGPHHNEIVRDARIDEMAYSIDPSGYTIVPTFTVLPVKDDAV